MCIKKLLLSLGLFFSFFFCNSCILAWEDLEDDEDLTNQVEFYIEPIDSTKISEKICIKLTGEIASTKYDKFVITIRLTKQDLDSEFFGSYEDAELLSNLFQKKFSLMEYESNFNKNHNLNIPCEFLLNDLGKYCISTEIVTRDKNFKNYGVYRKKFEITVTE